MDTGLDLAFCACVDLGMVSDRIRRRGVGYDADGIQECLSYTTGIYCAQRGSQDGRELATTYSGFFLCGRLDCLLGNRRIPIPGYQELVSEFH